LGTICNLWYRGWTADRSQWTQPLSRLLVLLLTTVLLLVMPVTEHLCNWDHFLRGWADVEFSLLAWLLFAAMVVLSMNGTMLQATMMQPGMIGPLYALSTARHGANAGSGTTARSVIALLPASSPSHSRSLDESAPAFDSSKGSRAPIPMRI
jgi:hypothetical protein